MGLFCPNPSLVLQSSRTAGCPSITALPFCSVLGAARLEAQAPTPLLMLSIFAELQLKETFQRQFPEFGYGQILVRRKNVSMKNMNVPFEKTQLGSPTNTTCNAARGFLIASPS